MKVLCEKSGGCEAYGCLHRTEHIRVESCKQGCYLLEEDWHIHKCSNKLIRKNKLKKLNKTMKKKLLNDIDNMLSNIVSPAQADSIMNSLTYKPNFKDYKKGDVMTVGEAKKLKEGDLIHLKYYNEDGRLTFNDIDAIFDNCGNEICTKGMYPFPIKDWWEDTMLLKNADNSGHLFTVSKVCKK